ncbi:MAG TPA: hypothetical protein IAD02_01625 [Candidatus Enterousia intestinigallinarum]|uniref:Uncharacterized protein n=1 Tax=Candidatus Enterousia intestinigallinarum TaxID=2840790 RepID=A0A9D1FFA1_9PROT|nr:hypothetical protein [Candidatus Enterousia intestinigallinarum]
MCEFWGCVNTDGWNWTAIGAAGTWFVGIVGAILVAYQLWLQIFARKIKVLSCTPSMDMFHGDGFDIVLLNEGLAPKSITKVQIVSNNKYISTIKEFAEPLILEPYKAVKISGDRYAEIKNTRNPIPADWYFIVEVDGHKRFIKYKGKINKRNIGKLTLMSDTGICRYGKEFLSKNVCAVLGYRFDDKDEYSHIFILLNGLMSNTFVDFNCVPKEAMQSIATLRKFFEDEIVPCYERVQLGIQGVLKWHNK